jgi:hypothetical protein
MKTADQLYEELRAVIDNGNESMTHEDALDEVRALRGELPAPWTPASEPPPESEGEVLVRMPDGRCEIAWATYWHGASNAFAQWTFRGPDETEQPVAWMRIPNAAK